MKIILSDSHRSIPLKQKLSMQVDFNIEKSNSNYYKQNLILNHWQK